VGSLRTVFRRRPWASAVADVAECLELLTKLLVDLLENFLRRGRDVSAVDDRL